MIKLLYLEAKNIITYDNLNLTFPDNELRVIRGGNRSGKSLAYSLLGNIIYFSPPLDRKKNTAKKLHNGNSYIRIGIQENSKISHIEQKSKNSGVNYVVYQHDSKESFDPKKHNIKIRSEVKNEIQKLFHQKEQHFYTYTYINALRDNILQVGTSAQRHDFFESLFSLEIYDSIRNKLNKYLGELKKKKVTLEYILDKKVDHDGHLFKEYNITKLDKLESLQNNKNCELKLKRKLYNKLFVLQTKFKQRQDTLNKYFMYYDNIKHKDLDLSTISKKIIKLNIYISNIEDKTNKLKDLIIRYNELKPLHDKRLKYKKALTKLKQIKSIEYYESKIIKLNELITTYNQEEEKAQQYNEIKQELETNAYPSAKPVKVLKDILDNIKFKLTTYTNNIKIFSNISSKKICPTCKQQLNPQETKIHLYKAKRIIIKYNSHKIRIEKQIEYVELKEKLATLTIPLYKDPTKYIFNLNKLLNSLTKKLHFAKIKYRIKTQISTLDINELPKLPHNSNNLIVKYTKALDKYKILLDEYKSDEKFLNKLGNKNVNKLEIMRSNIEIKLMPLMQKINSTQENIEKLNIDLSMLKHDINISKDFEKDITQYNIDLKDFELYKDLVLAYGPKGIRIEQLKGFAKLFEDCLNKYSSLVFAENFQFKLNVTENKFDIIALRSGLSSDVQLLSGSETQCFRLLCLLSMLSIIPDNMRTNVLILDEIDSNCGEETLKLIADEFLPRLKAIIPHLVIITPRTSEEFPISCANSEYHVVKQGGKSKITRIL